MGMIQLETTGLIVTYNDDFQDQLMCQVVGQGVLSHHEAQRLYTWLEEYLRVYKELAY
jgi:hypothetical protein